MEILAYIFLFFGVGVVVASSLTALFVRGVLVRLHFLSPVTSVGGPLIGVALAIQNGWGLTTALIVVTVIVLGFCGPIVEVATARVAAQREGILVEESPQ